MTVAPASSSGIHFVRLGGEDLWSLSNLSFVSMPTRPEFKGFLDMITTRRRVIHFHFDNACTCA